MLRAWIDRQFEFHRLPVEIAEIQLENLGLCRVVVELAMICWFRPRHER